MRESQQEDYKAQKNKDLKRINSIKNEKPQIIKACKKVKNQILDLK